MIEFLENSIIYKTKMGDITFDFSQATEFIRNKYSNSKEEAEILINDLITILINKGHPELIS